MRSVVAPMRVGKERLAAVADPFHRPADALRRPQRHHLFGIDEDLGPEAAADVGRDHAQLMLGCHPHEGRDHEPRHMRVLGGVPERQLT